MSVQLVKKEYDALKEISEVLDFVDALLKAILPEGTAAERMQRATVVLPQLITAIEGIDKVKAELKHEQFGVTLGAGLGRIANTVRESL